MKEKKPMSKLDIVVDERTDTLMAVLNKGWTEQYQKDKAALTPESRYLAKVLHIVANPAGDPQTAEDEFEPAPLYVIQASRLAHNFELVDQLMHALDAL